MYDDIRSLIQLDIDAIEAYDQAIDKVDTPSVRSKLIDFKGDHQTHIDKLSEYLLGKGEEVPDMSPDIKGSLMEGFTSMRSSTGTDGALKAMKSNEKATNKKYEKATGWALDAQARDIVLQNYNDEKKHLAYIEEQLSVKA